MCSFCVCLCGWTRSLCLSALPSNRAPDEVIRTVTGVARLHCLYLAGVSVMRCQIVVLLLWCTYSLCQSSRSWSCSRLVVFQYIPVGCGLDCILCPSWRLCTAGFTAPALPMISAPPLCLESAPALPAYLTSTVFWSCQIKTICFHSQLDLELSVPWQRWAPGLMRHLAWETRSQRLTFSHYLGSTHILNAFGRIQMSHFNLD